MPITAKQLARIAKGGYATETDLVRACLGWLTAHGVYCWRNNTGIVRLPGKGGKLRPVTFGKVGSSDILGVARGRLVAVECKQPGNRPSPEQAAFLEAVRANGGIAIVAHDLDELEQQFREQQDATR